MRATVPGVAASIIGEHRPRSRAAAVVRVGDVEVVDLRVERRVEGAHQRDLGVRGEAAQVAQVRGVHREQQVGRVVAVEPRAGDLLRAVRAAVVAVAAQHRDRARVGRLAHVPRADAGGVDDDGVAEPRALDARRAARTSAMGERQMLPEQTAVTRRGELTPPSLPCGSGAATRRPARASRAAQPRTTMNQVIAHHSPTTPRSSDEHEARRRQERHQHRGARAARATGRRRRR